MQRPLPANDELARSFERLADLLELAGADPYRPLAYRRAARRIRESGASVAELALAERADRLPGIGKAIQAKIVELVRTGDLASLRKLRAEIPDSLVEVMHVPGLGPKTVRRLFDELGVESLDDLRAAAEVGRLRTVPGLGAKTEERVLAGLAEGRVRRAPSGRTLLATALPRAREAVAALAAHPASVHVAEAGSLRRRTETVKDVDVVAAATDADALIEALVGFPWVVETLARGGTKAVVVCTDGLRVELRVVAPQSFGNLLQHVTGSKDHNLALREDAVRRGLSVSEYGVEIAAARQVVRHADEEELYGFLGYAWIPPELRENAGELEAAREGRLPRLVERADVLGDLHVHSDWSDGRATLEEMVAAARARGHRYVAICDHARRLREGRLERQAEAIATLNASVDGLEVLHGVETDIRADGSLDLDDEALAGLDWVVASVHSGFSDPRDRATGRVLAAIEHPHVDCIGHPTGRRIDRREPLELDLEQIFARAAETGTCLEINGQPDRLDLRDTYARLAAEAGVDLVLSSDAHSPAGLDYLELAVFQARRGWVTPEHVLNARAWPAVRDRRRR